MKKPPKTLAPGALTAANIACGFSAMLVSVNGQYEIAVYLLFAAIFLDMFDGRIARRLNATSEFGQQMDSFSDCISFGAAPAFIIYSASLQPLRGFGVACSLVYLLAGVFRLARFNLSSDAHEKSRRTVGVPIPVSASYVMVAILMRHRLEPWMVAGLMLFLAVAMVSKIPLPEFKSGVLLNTMMGIGITNYCLLVAKPNWYTVIWWNFWNLAIYLMARSEDRNLDLDVEVPS